MRSIDADALIGTLHNVTFEDGTDREIVYRCIELAPTIEERKTGKWKKRLITTVPLTVYGYECPFCEFRTATNSFNFCPNCG